MHNAAQEAGVDRETIERLQRISTATLTMVLLKRGIRRTWMRGPAPVFPDAPRVVGPAFTVRFVPAREDLATPESYAKAHSFRDAIERCPAGSIMVIDGCRSHEAATLGDILIARLKVNGVLAAVTDAPVRDIAEIRKVGLPVFSAGAAAPPSITGLVYAGYGELIGCGDVAVAPGDLIVGDADGVVVVPRALAEEVAAAGLEQERYERFVQMRVLQGNPVVGLYPPNTDTLTVYQRWLAAGEPPDWTG